MRNHRLGITQLTNLTLMKTSLSKQNKRTPVKTRRKAPLRNRTTKSGKLKKTTRYQVDRARLISLRQPRTSVQKPTGTPISDQKPNPVTRHHITTAMTHGMELANAAGQSAPFLGEGAWYDNGGGFVAKRDLRTKLKMTNLFYAPGYSTTPTTAQGGGYGFYRGRFHVVANDLTTPIPGTDHRPFGFNEIAAFYTYYEVHSCKIRLNIQNLNYGGTRGTAAPPGAAFACVFPISYDYSAIAGTNPGSPPNTGTNPLDNTVSGPFWSREVLSLQPHVEHAVMTNPNGGKPWCLMEQHWTTAEILGTQTEDEFNFKGACTPGGPTSTLQPPSNVWNYVVSMNAIPRSGLGGGGTAGAAAFGQPSYLALAVQVSLEWDVTFFDARLIQPSEAPALRSLSPPPSSRYPALTAPDSSDDEKEDSESDLAVAPGTNPFAL